VIEDDRWCPDVVTQVSSVSRALQDVAVGLLNDHLHVWVMDAARKDPAHAEERLDEVVSAIRQVVRL
jgi:CsoR family transcriptional regulator, copper-sensing transcriptional repressor